MNEKKIIKEMIEQIPVPRQKVIDAIHSGTKRSPFYSKRKRGQIRLSIGLVAALTLFFASGFINPTIGRAFAQLPWIGHLYARNGDSLGEMMLEEGKTQALNLTETKNGINVTVNDAYYEGDILSFTGTVTGDIPNLNKENELSLEIAEQKIAVSEGTAFEEIKNGYKFQIHQRLSSEQIPDASTFLLEITTINGVKGPWTFSIPLKQSKGEKIDVDKTLDFGVDGLKYQLVSLNPSEKISTLDVQINQSKTDATIEGMKILDEEGNDLLFSKNSQLLDNGNQRLQLKELPKKNTKYTFEAVYEQNEYSKLISLEDKQTLLTSSFDPLSFQLLNSKVENGKAVITYQVKHAPKKSVFVHNLGYCLRISTKDYHAISDNNTDASDNASQTSSQVKVIDGEKGIYQNTFDLTEKEQLTNATLDELYFSVKFDEGITETQTVKASVIFYQ
ncbi:DUF4179 domain-containing protein [Enterococcus massiliensis]|uniref:DUF4179 domain-containing protein n=1 Tax=Enterococcus massiliensis TaxID=1640685 RepID=UPI00065E2217|nr:DUF4179 domain-containing protein [Enterococcus massiliensis]